MKRHAVCFVAALLSASDFAFAQSLPDRVEKLEQVTTALTSEVTSLQQRVVEQEARIDRLSMRLLDATRSAVFDVDCGAGQTVNGALQEARRHPGWVGVTIRITGICREAVRIARRNTTLIGASSADGIEAPDSDSWAVFILGARVVIERLSIQGGTIGVGANAGSDVTLESVRISGARVHAVGVDGRLAVSNSVLDGNNEGVFAADGSRVSIAGSTISNSAADGVFLTTGATAHIGSGSRIENNSHGVALRFGASLSLDDAVIAGNRRNGVSVTGASTVELSSDTVIDRNVGNGVHLHDTSVLGAWGPPTITNNGGFAVQCTQPPGVAQVLSSAGAGSGLWQLSGNALGDMQCPVSQGP